MNQVVEAINIIEAHYTFSQSQAVESAWQTLKAAVLAQQTNNTGSPKFPPLLECFSEIPASNDVEFVARSMWTIIRRKLRAGA